MSSQQGSTELDRSTRRALYPGSFDPIHLGHVDIVAQAAELFGTVIVVAMHNPAKPSGLFGIEQRLRLLRDSLGALAGVEVAAGSGLAVDVAAAHRADFIVKGLRNGSDFDVEMQMAQTNYSVTGMRTVFLPCGAAQGSLSSRFIREISHYGGDVSHMVPAAVAQALADIHGHRPAGDRPSATQALQATKGESESST